jgi:hypothetical protein
MAERGIMTNIIDNSSPEAIWTAIHKVNQTPGLRDRTGIEALWRVFHAPHRSLPYEQLVAQFGAPNLHFGWFCRRVAEELGISNPGEYALMDRSTSEDGRLLLTLKPSVVAALSIKVKPPS